jgi:L,D-transpeptidase catalytic domain
LAVVARAPALSAALHGRRRDQPVRLARALYLGKTAYRIHGTNQPSTIGTFVSSGCIRLTNDVTDLYHRIQVGTRVVVLPGRPPATAAATSLAPLAAMPSQAAPPAPPPSVMAR